ncbi:chain length determinant protein EpsF [Curvibacter sp. CHRR-16]|uniref:GNVR domain-containing protein n=1 Tax=Curvibacter sp. CHRR-16 TaxID=2835872 RepID=UPI001BDA24AA|nr:GNVR domain-containing protein [Curvibacter sp. CHRR-16]MBT0571533.1 chain length determinant protein EpsF [Curvibacter sp. CHRR-16]
MNPKQILLILFAHRYLSALAFVVALLGGVAYTFTVPKTYQASTDLLLDTRIDPIAGSVTIASNYISTQVSILQSERVAIGVVKRLRVAETPALVDQWKEATKGLTPLENYYANLLRRGLTVEPLRNSNVIRLTFEAADPKFATAVVNTYAQSYVDLVIDLRVEPVRQYADWFEDRLKNLRDAVDKAQTRLTEYQRDKNIVSGSDQRVDAESQRLDALNAQLAALQGEKMDISSRQKTSGTDLSPDVQTSALVQGLKADINKTENSLAALSVNLGPNHPQRQQLESQLTELKNQLASEIARASGVTRVAKTTASLREAELKAAIAAQKERVLSMKEERDQVALLTQDVEAAKRMYDSVLSRSNQLNLEKQADQANVSILSPAVEPTEPSRPNRPKYLATSLAAALGAAFAVALGLEMLNRKVRVVGDIAIEGVPVLGVIDRQGAGYGLRKQLQLLRKFFTQRKQRKDFEVTSRMGDLM